MHTISYELKEDNGEVFFFTHAEACVYFGCEDSVIQRPTRRWFTVILEEVDIAAIQATHPGM